MLVRQGCCKVLFPTPTPKRRKNGDTPRPGKGLPPSALPLIKHKATDPSLMIGGKGLPPSALPLIWKNFIQEYNAVIRQRAAALCTPARSLTFFYRRSALRVVQYLWVFSLTLFSICPHHS